MKKADCITQMFDFLEKEMSLDTYNLQCDCQTNIAKYKLKLVAHIGSRFDHCFVLTFVPTWCRTVNPIKTSETLITVKKFTVFSDVNGTISQDCKM